MAALQEQPKKLVIIGARSNLTRTIAEYSDATIISSGEMLNPDTTGLAPRNLPVIINSFQPAHRLSDFSDPVAYLNQSLGILARTLEWAKFSRCSRLIYTSSAVVYGNNPDCKEDDSVQTHGIHGAFKIAAEEMVASFSQAFGIEYTIVRLFNIYGGEDRFSVIHRLEQAVKSSSPFRLINSGQSLRDYTHVADAARTYVELTHGENPGVINIGRGKGICVAELIEFLHSKKFVIEIEHVARDEVAVCVANTNRLAGLIDVDSFFNPLTYFSDKVSP